MAAQACHPIVRQHRSGDQHRLSRCAQCAWAVRSPVRFPKAANQVVRFVYLVPQIGHRAVALPKLVAEPVPVKVPVVNVRHRLR